MQEEKTTEVSKESKHVAIHGSIMRLKNVRNSFQSLLDEIRGTDSPVDEPATKADLPKLVEFLDEAGVIIDGFNDDLLKIRDQLHTALF